MPRIYRAPAEVNTAELKAQALRRRAVLTREGCSTYTLGLREGRACIVCLCCGLGSRNPGDVRQRYCGFCHEFHSEWQDTTPRAWPDGL